MVIGAGGAVISRDSFVARFGPAAFASLILGFVIATRPLASIPRGIAITAIAIAWAASVFLRRRDVRAHGSAVSAIAGVIAAGQTNAGPLYGIACALFLLLCLASMRASRTAAGPVTTSSSESPKKEEAAAPPRSLRGLIIIVVTTVAVAAGFLTLLPILAKRLEARFQTWGGGMEETAFSTSMVLGSTRGMLQSDVIVMHIDGPRPEYLRGAVYDEYNGRNWRTTARGRKRTHATANGPVNRTATRITLVRGTPVGEDMRWFLPRGVCDLVVTPGRTDIDAFGVVRRGQQGDDPPTLSYGTTDCTSAAASILPPTDNDEWVDLDLRSALQPVLTEWEKKYPNTTSPTEKLAIIDRELGRFEYSLAVSRNKNLDPIVDFVTVHRAGHCEMFASAMVLLARMEGIPARVVGGYHVSEVNALTGRAVVRDRHAHAWVEAWVDGEWRTYDPTPGREANRKNAGILDHIGDVVSSAFERIAITISGLGTLGTAGVLAVFVAFLLAVRWIGQKLRTRRRRRMYSTSGGTPPLPCFESLSDALARAGHERAESEPLEAFARRLDKIGTPWSQAAKTAILHYARLRYGNIGDEDEVVRDVDRAARTVRTVRTRA